MKKIWGWSLAKTKREENQENGAIQTSHPMENRGVGINQSPLQENENVIFGFPKIGFTYEELAVASNGFTDSTFIGRGGFGSVHKGQLDDGREIAIKKLNIDSRWGERDFVVEVDVLSRVHHRHLVQLIGCCITKEIRMLVCEYVPNNTLEFHLHKRREFLMDWSTRLKIALGSAKALSYLHEDCQPRIVHLDIKVADFGLARLFPDGETHVYATQVVGTRGYLAPEYATTGEVREQSDTYSYGVVLLELITGKTPLICTNTRVVYLVDWARPLLMQALVTDNYSEIVDPRLGNNYNPKEMKLMVACASACVRRLPQERPPMSQVVLVLEGIANPDTLGTDKPIQSSGDLTSGSTHGTSSSNSGHIATDDTTRISMHFETEYLTVYADLSAPVDSPLAALNLSGSTIEPIPNPVAASIKQTMPRGEQLGFGCVGIPVHEVAASGTVTATVSYIDATRGDSERNSMNQPHDLNTEYMTAEMTKV